jgi:hypothetical protein
MKKYTYKHYKYEHTDCGNSESTIVPPNFKVPDDGVVDRSKWGSGEF